MKQTAASVSDQFGERAMRGQHDGDRVSPRFEHWQALALAVDGGEGHYVERLKEFNLLWAIELAVVGEATGQRTAGDATLDIGEVLAIAAAQVAGGVDFERRDGRLFPSLEGRGKGRDF